MIKLNIRGMTDEKRETKRLFCFLAIVVVCILTSIIFLPSSIVNAAVPHLINYQGRLTDINGVPLNGSYNLTFRIYDAETAGNLLWQETQTGVVIQKGIFGILLGSVTSLNLPFDNPYFLEIKVGEEIMSPRQRITSAGYAIRAERAEVTDTAENANQSQNAIQAQNANTVANVGVSVTPEPNKLLPLDGNAKLPLTALRIYDSGWFYVGNAVRNWSYTKTHNLGTEKVIIQILGYTGIGSYYYSLSPSPIGVVGGFALRTSVNDVTVIVLSDFHILSYADSMPIQDIRIIIFALE